MRKLVFSAVFAFVLSFALYSQASAETVNGWKNVSGNWHYYVNGTTYTGWLTNNGKQYYFDKNGVMKTGWAYFPEGPDGYSWYFFNSSGEMVTGWYKDKGHWYYFYENGRMATGWIVFNNSDAEYYANKDGQMQTGWVKVGYQWIYFQSNGLYKSGWVNTNGTWYYQDKNGMVTGWLFDNGAWYYFNNTGAMKTGWANVNGTWYYLGKTGAMKTGWFLDNGKWYYLNRNGVMKTGWLQLGDDWYYLYSNGAMAVNTTVDGYQIGDDGVWIQDNPPVQELEDTLIKIAAPYGITVEYNSDTEEFDLFDGDWSIGGVGLTGEIGYPGYVYGDPSYSELLIKLAIAAGAPATEAELQALIQEAEQTGELNSNGFTIFNNEYTLAITWGFDNVD